MKFINNKVHGFLDYLTVTAFVAIPSSLGLEGIPAYLSYTLACVHFLMTALTKFEFGIVKVLPLKLHKWVELAVGPTLVVIPWVLGFAGDIEARAVFMAAGVVIILVGQFSQYKSP
jgi:hypothetical protein